MTRAGRPTLTTPETWADAALEEIEHAGVRGLSAEAVARRLGVSKGGLYHHFADRRALLRAALGLWEERHVTALTARFEAIPDARTRLHELLVYAGVGIQPTVIVQLLAASDDADVAAVLRRSTAERLALLRRIFRQLGVGPAAAEHRAITTYSHFLGLAQLRAQDPALLAEPARMRAHIRVLEAGLLAGLTPGPES